MASGHLDNNPTALHTGAQRGCGEMVDALGLGPSAARRGGSSPSTRTTLYR